MAWPAGNTGYTADYSTTVLLAPGCFVLSLPVCSPGPILLDNQAALFDKLDSTVLEYSDNGQDTDAELPGHYYERLETSNE